MWQMGAAVLTGKCRHGTTRPVLASRPRCASRSAMASTPWTTSTPRKPVFSWSWSVSAAGAGPNAGLARARAHAVPARAGTDARLTCLIPHLVRIFSLDGSQGQTMEKMLTLTQDQFAALLKRELTTPAPLDPSSDDASKAAVLGALPKREAYRYATVRPRSRRRRAGAARPLCPPRLTRPRIWWAVDAERRHCDAVAAGLPGRPAAAQDL